MNDPPAVSGVVRALLYEMSAALRQSLLAQTPGPPGGGPALALCPRRETSRHPIAREQTALLTSFQRFLELEGYQCILNAPLAIAA